MLSTSTSTPSPRHGNYNGGHQYYHDITIHNLTTRTKLEAPAVVHTYDDDDSIFEGLEGDDNHDLRPDATTVDLSEDSSSEDSFSLLDDADPLDLACDTYNDEDDDQTTLEASFPRVIELLMAAFYIALVVLAFLWGFRLVLGEWLSGSSFNKLNKHRCVLESTGQPSYLHLHESSQ